MMWGFTRYSLQTGHTYALRTIHTSSLSAKWSLFVLQTVHECLILKSVLCIYMYVHVGWTLPRHTAPFHDCFSYQLRTLKILLAMASMNICELSWFLCYLFMHFSLCYSSLHSHYSRTYSESDEVVSQVYQHQNIKPGQNLPWGMDYYTVHTYANFMLLVTYLLTIASIPCCHH